MSRQGAGLYSTLSFPYVRDRLNQPPFAGSPDLRIIVSLKNGVAAKPTAMWSMMQQLKKRIARLIKSGAIADHAERERLEYLLKTKRCNPYCIRHLAITYDRDSLPEFALRKKVRWSMNSKQPGRYIKRRLGDGLKRQILAREGIMIHYEKDKIVVRACLRCGLANALENRICSKCGYPLSQEVLDEIKAREKDEMKKGSDRVAVRTPGAHDREICQDAWLQGRLG